MKKLSLFISLLLVGVAAFSQNPVKWTFSAKKIADKTYEVHFIATVQSPWHIYSQSTPDGGPLPTKFTFNKNPLLKTDDKTKEIGDLKQRHEEVFGVDVKYFNGNVEFVQVVKLKANAKTAIGGKLEFMACNDEQCMPPAEIPFSISLN